MFKIVLSPATDAIGSIGYWDKTWREELVYETGWMMLVERLRRDHMRRFLHAFPSVTNGPSNALCRKAGFINLGESDFEYPAGHPLRCNDWRLDLSLSPDHPRPQSAARFVKEVAR
jgi:RimJ/RimL family protein N-acetyltransferase